VYFTVDGGHQVSDEKKVGSCASFIITNIININIIINSLIASTKEACILQLVCLLKAGDQGRPCHDCY